MILVTGATGTTGRAVVEGLGRLSGGVRVRVLVRDAGRAVGLPVGVEVVVGDLGDEASLGRALLGVRAAFLLTCRVGEGDDVRFVRAARAAGVGRVVKLSAAAVTDPQAGDVVTCWQREAEAVVCGSGLEWTLLRPRAFMSNTLGWAASVKAERVVRALCATSRNACVDPRDVAAVAVCALTGPGHAGRAYTLTGPQALTVQEQARELGRQLGVELGVEELGREAARAVLGRRYPPLVVEALLDSACRQRAGAKQVVEPAVAALLGRPARSYRDWVGDHLDAFRLSGSQGAGAPVG
ncbi:NAD(P)H-binding protein [Streptomyces sp. NPDC002688]|uniref:NAD(P)H-binding protein n=1 Tax=Streptomyces sp. NPDC002688 TaxID=3154423 RepID=UPI0033318CEF